MNQIEETIKNLSGSISMIRAQINYAPLLVHKISGMIKNDKYSYHDMVAATSDMLKAIVAEGFVEGQNLIMTNLEKEIFELKIKHQTYCTGTIEDVNDYFNNIVKEEI